MNSERWLFFDFICEDKNNNDDCIYYYHYDNTPAKAVFPGQLEGIKLVLKGTPGSRRTSLFKLAVWPQTGD